MNQAAAECPSHSGYHIAAESVILEIADEEGLPVPPGVEGRIIATNLNNYAMPFIRYDTGDIGIISDKPCSCRRGLPLLNKLSGRKTDFISFRDGRKIPGTHILGTWHYHILALPASRAISRFQAIQEDYELLVVKIVLSDSVSREDLETLKKRIVVKFKELLGPNINVLPEIVDEIPVTRDGKFRVIISKVT
jgi:phenylacetate-CoA ligase